MNRTRLLIISMTLIACAAIAVAQTPRRRTGVAGPKPTPTPTPASVSSPPQQPADPPPATLAIVNDTSITQSDVADQINAAISNDPDLYLRAFYLDPEKEIKEARQRALEARINSLLIAAEARKRSSLRGEPGSTGLGRSREGSARIDQLLAQPAPPGIVRVLP